jgi:hypothetical protein
MVLLAVNHDSSPARAYGLTITSDQERLEAFYSRRDSLIDFYADRIPPSDLRSGGYIDIAAKLIRNQDLSWVLSRLDTLIKNPRGDMFWMYQAVTTAYTGRRNLPESYRARTRKLWRTYTPYRGDTENHWALYYTALYLISQLYPGEPADSWFNGKSSQENLEEAEEYLRHWMDLTVTIGQGEYDSPHYFGLFVLPMAQLYAWAADPDMKQRALMMIEYLLADFAVENLRGSYVGAHSRMTPDEVLQPGRGSSTGLAWLLFGDATFSPGAEAFILAKSGYEPSEILYRIATDRSAPYVHKERKRTRHRLRYSDVKNTAVYKYTYMTPEYALGSSQGGLLQPIQQHTWDLTWASSDPDKKRNTFFSIHPYSSTDELGMYFPEHLGMITELVVRSKPTYDSADKWTGGSPYEQVFQHEDALITLFDIPDGTRFPQISVFFSRDLTIRQEDSSGWIFARGGDTFIAWYPLAPYEWQKEPEGDWRLVSTALKNGGVLQTARAADYDSFETFKQDVIKLYNEIPKVNSAKVNYEAWPLFDGPFLYAESGSRKLEMRHGDLRRLLDFDRLTITDWVAD